MSFQLKKLSRLALVAASSRCPQVTWYQRGVHGVSNPEGEFTTVAEYPQILPYQLESNDHKKAKLETFVKSLKTVEEKLYYINRPKYYGWYSCVIDGNRIRYGTLDFAQYITNTTLVQGQLPPVYGLQDDQDCPLSKEAAKIVDRIQGAVQNFLISELRHREQWREAGSDRIAYREFGAIYEQKHGVKRPRHEMVQNLVCGIHRIILAEASKERQHLRLAAVDFQPRLEAFWFRGGFQPDLRMIKKKRGLYLKDQKNMVSKEEAYPEEKIYEPYDRCMQFLARPVVQLRCRQMLRPFINDPQQDELCRTGHVPQSNWPPQSAGYPNYCQHGSNVPGHWTGSRSNFGFLNVVSAVNDQDNLSNETAWSDKSEYNDKARVTLVKMLLTSFATGLSNACYQGFGPFNDPTMPFSTQTVCTDGQKWAFSVYQLNQSALLNEDAEMRNVCWAMPEANLFEAVNDTEVIGFNRSVLETLVKFYLLEPTVHEEDIDRHEYLGKEKFLSELSDTYSREQFTAKFRRLMSRAKRSSKPEIHPYQKLYMIDHPEVLFMMGDREQPWFRMAQYDHKGREHWHPEFRHLDYEQPPRILSKHRTKGTKKWAKKVVVPIPQSEQDQAE